MDDIRPTRSNGTPTSYGRPMQPQNQQINPTQPQPSGVSNQDDQQMNNAVPSSADTQHVDYHIPEQKKRGKGTKIALVFFILLSIASLAFAAYEYMEVQDLKAQVEELQQENARLTERVYSLNYDNRDLNSKVEMMQSEMSSLDELNQAYLKACGSACDDITP